MKWFLRELWAAEAKEAQGLKPLVVELPCFLGVKGGSVTEERQRDQGRGGARGIWREHLAGGVLWVREPMPLAGVPQRPWGCTLVCVAVVGSHGRGRDVSSREGVGAYLFR